jgi:hypothetical protein
VIDLLAAIVIAAGKPLPQNTELPKHETLKTKYRAVSQGAEELTCLPEEDSAAF